MRSLLAALAVVVLTLPLNAQDVTSGPDKGKKVPALKVHDLTGKHAEKTVDYAADRKDRPTIYLFVWAKEFDRPMNRFMKTLDMAVGKDFEDAYMVAVFITDDEEKTKTFLPRVQQSVQYQNTALTSFAGDKNGPESWNISPDARLTAVVTNKGKVTALFGYDSINETDVDGVKKAFKEAIGKKK